MPLYLEAFDLSEAWFRLLWDIFERGAVYTVERGSFAGTRRLEYDFVTVHVLRPGTRPLVPDVPPHLGIPAPVDMDYVEEYFRRYLLSTERAEGEQYTYGERILPAWKGW